MNTWQQTENIQYNAGRVHHGRKAMSHLAEMVILTPFRLNTSKGDNTNMRWNVTVRGSNTEGNAATSLRLKRTIADGCSKSTEDIKITGNAQNVARMLRE